MRTVTQQAVQLEAFESLVKSINDFWLTKVQVAASEERCMSGEPIKTLLVIEDNLGDARLLLEMLNEQGTGGYRIDACRVHERRQKYLATTYR